ncbi:MAG: M20/M25/M40 family metallo-hydrolase [Gemmatimonadaceae bacterium]
MTRLPLRAVPAALLLFAPFAAAPAQQARFDSAFFAWEAGDYPTALSRFERILTSNDGGKYLEPIALLTGEWYRTTQVATDGAAARWSADGKLATFTTNGGRTTHVVSVAPDAVSTVARIEGVGLVISPNGRRAAYFAIPETPDLKAARAQLDSLVTGGAPNQRLFPQRNAIARLERLVALLTVRELESGNERVLQLPELEKSGLAFSADGRSLYFVGATRADSARSDIFRIDDLDGAPMVRAVTEGPGLKHTPIVPANGEVLAYSIGNGMLALRSANGETRTFEVSAPAISADGSMIAWVNRTRDTSTISILPLRAGAQPAVIKRTARPLATPVPSPDGQRVAFAMQPFDDWEIFVVGADGQGETRVTREIQHDRFPRWLSSTRLLAVKGEPRHSRSYLYDVRTGQSQRLHHNNTVRTVAPEYEWAVSPDGTRVLVVADRDGDTISPERGVYLVDLNRTVTSADVLERIRASAAAERDLRERGRAMFAVIEARVRPVVRDVSVARIYEYEKAAYEFDSKHITQPGNAKAITYYTTMLKSFGYDVEVQWFEPRQGIRTANVIATLRGTVNPDLIYVVSSHFDSVAGGPGSDDDTSGSAALLETARVLAGKPQPATIKFAFFTGEEAGLLGSREFVRRALAAKDNIVGALNNDMIGWANDARLDNTIRYSNDGIRDLQHAAAFLFTDLITYDARYYRSTDAAAYYEAYGDIVGGIGSYPILGNPHYHQPHDILETINHQLVAEVSKTTVASLMLLAASPSRLKGLEVTVVNGVVQASWTPAPEKGAGRYVVAFGPPMSSTRRTVTVSSPRVTLPGAASGWTVSVKALSADGMQSWDWVRATVP